MMCLADADNHDEDCSGGAASWMTLGELRQQAKKHEEPHSLGRGYTVVANLLWTIEFKATFFLVPRWSTEATVTLGSQIEAKGFIHRHNSGPDTMAWHGRAERWWW